MIKAQERDSSLGTDNKQGHPDSTINKGIQKQWATPPFCLSIILTYLEHRSKKHGMYT